MSDNNLVIYGASGHGKVVVDVVQRQKKYTTVGFCDDNKNKLDLAGNAVPIISSTELDVNVNLFIAIGDNRIRKILYKKYLDLGFKFVTILDPSAIISDSAQIKSGSVVMPGVIINSDTFVSENSIINTRTSIDHDCYIGSHCHIAPGVTICGACKIGDNTFIGAGATIVPNIKIGANVIVGAGSVVLKDVKDNQLIYGVPAGEKH
jgi:sugar O-acyltransferase (sialic acid O-acetyltransferase NeuD family)